jgi:hypothetical protein
VVEREAFILQGQPGAVTFLINTMRKRCRSQDPYSGDKDWDARTWMLRCLFWEALIKTTEFIKPSLILFNGTILSRFCPPFAQSSPCKDVQMASAMYCTWISG